MEKQKTMVSPGSPGTPAAQLSRGLISFLPPYTLSPVTCLLGEPRLRHKVQLPTVDGPDARPGAPPAAAHSVLTSAPRRGIRAPISPIPTWENRGSPR